MNNSQFYKIQGRRDNLIDIAGLEKHTGQSSKINRVTIIIDGVAY